MRGVHVKDMMKITEEVFNFPMKSQIYKSTKFKSFIKYNLTIIINQNRLALKKICGLKWLQKIKKRKFLNQH